MGIVTQNYVTDSNRGFRQDINALRALGVALVVLFHFKVPGFSGGFAGVDIFFVVSGYLMTSIIVEAQERGNFSYATFLAARILRIWPALIVLTMTVVAAAMLWLPPIDLRFVARNGFDSLLFWSNQLYASQSGYFKPESEQNLLLHTWSLSVEWQFYMLFPLLLMLGRATLGRRSTIVVLGVVLLSSTAWCLSEPSPALRFFGLPSRAWELSVGGFAYLAGRSGQGILDRSYLRPFLAHGGMALILLSLAVINVYSLWPLPWAVLPVLGTAIFIVACHQRNSLVRSRAVQTLGLWSYSVYLWHWPLVAALHLLHWSGRAWGAVLGIPLSLLLGWASFRLVEEPVRKQFKRRVRLGTVAAAGGWVVVVVVAAVTVKLHGLPQRKPDLAVSLESLGRAEEDWSFPIECANWKVREHFVICPINGQLQQTSRWLVVGDSHAQHYYPYFKAHAVHRVDFLTSSGCLPVPGVNDARLGFSCPWFVDEVRKAVASGAYERVIVAAYWSGYFQGDDGIVTCIWRDNRCVNVINDAASRAYLLDEMEAQWSEFRRSGAEVTVVLPEPRLEHGESLPRELARRRFLGVDETEVASMPLNRYLADTEPLRLSILNIAKKVGASVVDPEAQLCHGGRCWLIDEKGAPILRDSNHFRASWIARDGHFMDTVN